MNIDILEKIEEDSSRLVKESLLIHADEQLRRLIELALDQNITFGVTVDEDEAVIWWKRTGEKLSQPDIWWGKIESFLADDLAPRKMTGNAALAEVKAICEHAPDTTHLKWFCRILNRNLRAGFDIRTYNRVFGKGAVKKFEIQLADVYEGDPLRGLWFFQPKLDGNRVVLIDGKAMSRGNKEYPNCEHVIKELLDIDKDFFKKWVVDGEMMGNLGFDQSSGALRRTSKKGAKAEFTYWAFDIISRKEWELQRTQPLKARNYEVESMLTNLRAIKVVPTKQILNPTHKQVMELLEEYIAQGFEGAMAKDASSPYVFKRGSNLLKVKKFYDADLKIVDFYEGNGKHKGRLGGIWVSGEIDGKPIRSKVGSGFDDDLRGEIWDRVKVWGGAVVQVQYQEITPVDKKTGFHSLRFPVFIMRRKDKE
jgi:ATP dependent DNA ligase domain/DNA ligase OB-like domain